MGALGLVWGLVMDEELLLRRHLGVVPMITSTR